MEDNGDDPFVHEYAQVLIQLLTSARGADGLAESLNFAKGCSLQVDVYLSKSLADSLYVFQYPVRPAHLSYDDIPPLAARIKPQQQKVELEMAVNSRGANYAFSKGEQLALNVDGSRPDGQGCFFNSAVYDKQVLSSMPQAATPSNYAIGLLKDGELHLTPVHGIVQLKPTFSYLDRADTKHKADSMAGAEAGEGSQDEGEDDAQAVTIKFARAESDEAKARRMRSYNYVQGKREEEPWVTMDYHSRHEDRSEAERLMLYANKTDEVSEFQMVPKAYVGLLVPKPGEKTEEKAALPNNVLSLSQLRTLPLSDQIRALLINAKTLRFNQLLALLQHGTDPTAALRSLQQVALLVQGCWVVKSDIMYPKDSCSPHSGISAEVMCRSRDYVMWKFTQSRCVQRKEVSSVVKLPAEDMKEVLEQMSRMRAGVGWEFLYTFDKEFTDRYQEIVQRQQMLWDAKYQTLSKLFKVPKEADRKSKDNVPHSPEKSPRRRRTSSKSSRVWNMSGRSMSDISDTDTENMEKHDGLVCNNKLVEKMEVDGCTESGTNINNAEQSKTISEESLVKNSCTIDAMDTTNHVESMDDAGVSNGDKSVLLQTELLKFTREKICSRVVLSKTDLKRLFSLLLTQCPTEHVLRSGVSDKMLEDSILASGAVKVEVQGHGVLFLLKKKGDGTDEWRSILVDILQTSHKLRITKLKQKVEEETGIPINDKDCKQLLKEYCETKAGSWYIKGTTEDVS